MISPVRKYLFYIDNIGMAEAVNLFDNTSSDDGRANTGGRIVFSQTESFLPRQNSPGSFVSLASASMSADGVGLNRAFGDRSANSSSPLPDLSITGTESRAQSPGIVLGAMSLERPIPVFPRTNEAANFMSPAFRAPTLQELSNRRQLSGPGDMIPRTVTNGGPLGGDSLDRLSRGALDYVSTNADQMRRSVARGPYEGANAQRFLPNVTLSPSASSYNFEMPGNWQSYNNGFQGCPCPHCASGAYRPDAGPRPYQQRPWQPGPPGFMQPNAPLSFQGYDPNGRFDPNPNTFGPRQQPNQRYDALVPRPGEFRPQNSNRVTPDMLPPGWFEEIYGSPNQPAPRPAPGPRPPGPEVRPRPRPPGPGQQEFDASNLPPPRPDLVQPGAGDIQMLSQPSISPEKIDEVLRHYRSPAVGVGRELYALGVRYGIDPAIALGFFIVESTAGRHGRASRNMSWGNIKGRGPAGSDGTFRRYNSWAEGAEDWFKLIRNNYIATEPNEGSRRPFGAQTLRAVIRRYAPGSDGNNEGGYVRQVISMRQRWAREMLAQQPAPQRTAEAER